MAASDPRLVAIGRALYAHRTAAGLSQRQLAAELKLSFSTVSRIENAVGADLTTLLRVMDWLGLAGAFLGPALTAVEAYQRSWDDCTATIRDALERAPGAD